MHQFNNDQNSSNDALRATKTALLALGSNQSSHAGGPEMTLKSALERLARDQIVIRAVSRMFDTPSYPPGSGPNFVNAAAKVETTLSAEGLLSCLHDIEAGFGRERRARWQPRPLDLDLLGFDGEVLPDAQTFNHWAHLPLESQTREAPDRIILPHPRLQDRAFVLVPLADIAPDWVHPVFQQTVSQMLDALPAQDRKAVKPLVK